MRLGLVVNDIEGEYPGYTTTHLAMEAVRRGHEVWYIPLADLELRDDDRLYAKVRIPPPGDYRFGKVFLAALTGPKATIGWRDLGALDILWLRNDPSQDVERRPWARMAGIDFGRLAVRNGLLVLSDPEGLARGINKLYLQYFPERVRPKTVVTRDPQEALRFIQSQGGYAILKPLSGSGGRSVFLVRPVDGPNVHQMMEAVARDGYMIVQEFLPNAHEGDTRLFMLNGRPLVVDGHYAAVRRKRREGDEDIRSNLTAGGVSVKAEVTEEMLEIAELVGPQLVADGIYFAGLDIIGGKLTEINVQSPGALVGADRLEGVSFTAAIIDDLERKLAWRAAHPEADNRTLACA